jgi:hypothetical protein
MKLLKSYPLSPRKYYLDIYHQSPMSRTIFIHDERLCLPFPDMLFFVNYIPTNGYYLRNSFSVVFTDSQLRNLSYVPLPNIFGCDACSSSSVKYKLYKTREEICYSLIEDFWVSKFSAESNDNFFRLNLQLLDYQDWQQGKLETKTYKESIEEYLRSDYPDFQGDKL